MTGSDSARTASVPAAPRSRDGSGGYTKLLRYLAGRILGAAVSLLAVTVTAFFLFRILPGDPVQTMTQGRAVSVEQLEALRREFGLDKPLWQQFLDYMLGLFQGDLGTSYQYRQPVTELIGERLWATVLLVGTATAISALLGLWLGTRGGWKHGSTADRANTGVALALWSVPSFWLGLILIVLFASGLNWFPTGAMVDPQASGVLEVSVSTAYHLVLPVATMVAVIYAQYLMIMRSSLLDEMGSDYLVTARAKGMRDDLVLRRHAVPNALLPTVTLIFVNLGQVVAGTILVETVFSWPGLGSLFYEALTVPDLPLVQGLFLFFSGGVIVMNLLADLMYPLIDPRVRV